MTPKQLEICQHALGLDQYGRGTFYRNRFVTGPGCNNWVDLRALVRLGLMKDHGLMSITGGMHCFSVTEKGIAAVKAESPAPPKLTRSQQRYQRFLDADCGLTFKEWLKCDAQREKEASSWC